MFCTPEDDPLARALEAEGFAVDATATVLSHGVAPEAFKRAEELLAGGASPEHALKWLGLALYKRGPEDWLQSLYLYCRAVEMEDQPQADRVRRHLLRLDVPEPIRAALD